MVRHCKSVSASHHNRFQIPKRGIASCKKQQAWALSKETLPIQLLTAGEAPLALIAMQPMQRFPCFLSDLVIDMDQMPVQETA